MGRLVRLLVAVVAVVVGVSPAITPPVVAAAPPPYVCTANWVGPFSGFQRFDTAANWDTGVVPGPGSTPCFPTGSNVRFNFGSFTVATVGIAEGATVTMAGGSLTLESTSNLARFHLLGGGVVTLGADSVVSGGELRMETGRLLAMPGLADPPTLTVEPDATVTHPSPNTVSYVGVDIVNDGTYDLTAGSVEVLDGVTLVNRAALTVGALGRIVPSLNGTGRFVNESSGTIGVTGFDYTPFKCCGLPRDSAIFTTFESRGLIRIDSGSFHVHGATTIDGAVEIAAGAQLGLGDFSLPLAFGAGSSVTGAGIVRNNRADAKVDAAATFEPGQLHAYAGRITIAGDRTLPPVWFGNGRLDIDGVALASGEVVTRPGFNGTIGGTGSLLLPEGARFGSAESANLTVAGGLSVRAEGGIVQGRTLVVRDQASLVSTGTWVAEFSGTSTVSIEGSATVANEGTLEIWGAARANNFQFFGRPFDNRGIIRLVSGTVDGRAGLVQATGGRLTGGTIDIGAGTMWMFLPATTAIDGHVVIRGDGDVRPGCSVCSPTQSFATLASVSAGGSLTITGGDAFATSAPTVRIDGSLAVDAGSTVSANAVTFGAEAVYSPSVDGTSAGRVATTGVATLGGALRVRAASTAPLVGGDFRVLDASNVGGSFASVAGDAGTGDATFRVTGTGVDVSIEGTDLGPVAGAAADLDALIGSLYDALPTWAGAFDLDDLPRDSLPPIDLPLLTDELAAAFDLAEAIGGLEVPRLTDVLDELSNDLAEQTAALVAELEALGCTVDWAATVPGQPQPATSGDILQVRCRHTPVAVDSTDPLRAGASGILDGLADDVTITATDSLDAELVVETVFGIDGDGAYLLSDTGAQLDIDATMALDGTGTVASGDTTFDGSIAADLTAELRAGAALGVRVRDLTSFRPELAYPSITGEVTATAGVAIDPFELTWQGGWTVDTADVGGDAGVVAVELGTQRVDGTLELPGAGPTGTANIAASGERDPDGTWTVTADGTDLELGIDGFALTGFEADAVIDADSVIGSGSVTVVTRLALPGGGNGAEPIETGIEFDGRQFRAEGRRPLDDLALGEPPLLWIDRVMLDAAIAIDLPNGTAAIDVTLDGRSGDDGVPGDDPGVIVVFPNEGDLSTGAVVVEDFIATVDSSGAFSLSAAEATGSADGVIDLVLEGVELELGPQFSFAVESATATFPGVEGLEARIDGLTLDSDGVFGFDSIEVQGTLDSQQLDLGGVLPFTAELTARFTNPDDLTEFELEAVGSFDFEALADLGFEPSIRVGDQVVTAGEGENTFSFSVRVIDGVLHPVDVADIVLEIRDLAVNDQMTVAGELRLGGVVDGVLVPTAGGTLTIEGGFDDVEGTLTATLDGEYRRTADGAVVELTGATTVSGTLVNEEDEPVVDLEDLVLDYDVVVTRDSDGVGIDVVLDELAVGRLEFVVNDLITFAATDTTINLTPGPGDPIARFDPGDGLTVEFSDELLGATGGEWGGSVAGFAIGQDLVPYALDGFSVTVSPPDGLEIGLPEWMALRIDEAGIEFPRVSGPPGSGSVTGGIELGDLTDLRVTLSGELTLQVPVGDDGGGGDPIGVSAFVDGLEIDLRALIEGRFPITNLDAGGIGIEPIDLGAVEVGGSLAIGVVEDADGEGIFYLKVSGVAAFSGIGAGADLLLTEQGPLVMALSAPLGIPVGPTGVLFAGVSGGVIWGGAPAPEPINPDDPGALLNLPLFEDLGQFDLDQDRIEELVLAAAGSSDTWNIAATMALSGTFTHAITPGVLNGTATLAANIAPGDNQIDLFGKGEVDLYGLGVGTTGARLSFADPLAPALEFALVTPPVGSPLAAFLPVRTEAAAVLDTSGLQEATAAALTEFFVQLQQGMLDIGPAYFTDVTDVLAARLEADRVGGGTPRPLTQAVLAGSVPGDTEITGDLLRSRLTTLVDPGRQGAAARQGLTTVLLAEMTAAAMAVTAPPPALSADDRRGLDGLLDANATAAAAFVAALREASSSATRVFLDRADPRLVVVGSLQPTILGFPFGDPTAEVELTVSKEGLGLRVGVSILALIGDTCDSVTIGFCKIMSEPLGWVYQDYVTASLELPIQGVIQRLADGDPMGALDAASVWGVSFEGSVGMFGMKMVELSGLLVPPGNDGYVAQRTQLLVNGRRFDPADTARPVPIASQAHYDNLVDHGGLILTGNLRAPELLVDPVTVINRSLIPPPENPLEIPAWIAELGTSLSGEVSPGYVQLYLPADSREAQRSHIVGEWDATVLSMPFTDGRFSLGEDGIELVGRLQQFGAEGRLQILPPRILDGLPVPVVVPDPVGLVADIVSGGITEVIAAPNPNDPAGPGTAFGDVFDPGATGPAPSNAYLLALIAGGGYIEAHPGEPFRSSFAGDLHGYGLRDVTFIEDASTDTELVAARSENAVVVSFRGTEPSEPGVDGALVDASFGQLTRTLDGRQVGVHGGFWTAADSVYAEIVEYLESSGERSIWLTGHSLGGSLATVTAARLAADGYDIAGVQTIGAPNVGDQRFTTMYDGLGLGDRTHRWVNDRDLVPMLLDLVPNYAEVGQANVFLRGTAPGTFTTEFDAAEPGPGVGLGMDDHDSALYAQRILSLVPPDQQALLPAPPAVTTDLLDIDWAVEATSAYGVGLDVVADVLGAAGLDPQDSIALLFDAGMPLEQIAVVVQAAFDLTAEAAAPLLTAIAPLPAVGLALWQAYSLSLVAAEQLIADAGATFDDLRELQVAIAAEPSMLFPRASLEVSVSTAAMRTVLERDLRIPSDLFVPLDQQANQTTTVRAFTPGFDPDAVDDKGRPDLLRRRGGVQLASELQIPDLLEKFEVRLDVTPSASGFGADFTGTALIDDFTPVRDFRIEAIDARISGAPGRLPTIDLSGRAVLFGSAVNVDGSVESDGTGRLDVTTDGPFDLGAFQLDGSFTVILDGRDSRLEFEGVVVLDSKLAQLLGQATVAVRGAIGADGSFDFALDVDDLRLGAVVLDSGQDGDGDFLRLVRTAAGVVTVAVDGRLAAESSGLPLLSAVGTLSSDGLGSLELRAGDGEDTPLVFGGLRIGGRLRFERALEGTVVVQRFTMTNASVGWSDLFETTVPLVEIATDGSMRLSLPGGQFGQTSQMYLGYDGIDVAIDAGSLDARLEIDDVRLTIPGLPRVPGQRGGESFDVGDIVIRTVDFSVPVTSFDQFELGPISIDGRLLVEREGGLFRARLTTDEGRVPHANIAGFGGVEVPELEIESDGTFRMQVETDRIGPDGLHIVDASVLVEKTSSLRSSFRMRIEGGQLVLPIGAPIGLPLLEFTTAPFDRTFTTPAIDLGPLFQVRPAGGTPDPRFGVNRIGWRIALVGDVMRLELVEGPLNRPELRTFAGAFDSTLQRLAVSSAGEFSGRMRTGLTLFGQRLAPSTYSISVADRVARFQSIGGGSFDFGFGDYGEYTMSGSFATDGSFDFTGGGEVRAGVCVFACVDGDATMRLSSATGVSGTYSGEVCVAGVVPGVPLCASASGTIRDAVVSGTVVVPILGARPYSVDLNPFDGPDVTRPRFTADPLPRVSVRGDVPTANPVWRVNYATPTATDDSGTVTVSCSPASGTMFPVGQTEVRCTASDPSGNRTTRSFIVNVYDETLPVLAGGPTGTLIGATTGPFDPSRPVRVTLFSDPIELAVLQPDLGTGMVTFEVAIPDAAPPGLHQVVVEGYSPDGDETGADELIQFTFMVEVTDPNAAPGVTAPPSTPSTAPAATAAPTSGPGAPTPATTVPAVLPGAGPGTPAGGAGGAAGPAGPPTGRLPQTGGSPSAIVSVAITLLLAGVLVVVLARRRRVHRT